MKRALFLCIAFLVTPLLATPPVRLLSVETQTARVRVTQEATPTKLNELVNALHTSGVASFHFETTDDRLLSRLKSVWLDSGIKEVIIKKPQALSAKNLPKLDPLEALAALEGLDREIANEKTDFGAKRGALVSFIYKHGNPEFPPGTNAQSLQTGITETKAYLKHLLETDDGQKLQVAASVPITGNPVLQALEKHQEAVKKKDKLSTSGIGRNHPGMRAINEEITTNLQIASDEISSLEEALRVKVYQLGKQQKHFDAWQKHPREKQLELTSSYRKLHADYLDSLNQLQQLEATRKAAHRSLPKSD